MSISVSQALPSSISVDVMDRWLLPAALVLTFVPVKNSQYLLPPLYLAYLLLAGRWETISRVATYVSVLGSISCLSLLIDAFQGRQVSVPGFIFALYGYLPLIILWASLYDRPIAPALHDRNVTAVCIFIIAEGLVGAAQFIVFKNGDAVCGTFGLLDGLGGITISQVYYTFVLFCSMLFISDQAGRPIVRVAFVVGILACVIAQSGHQTIFILTTIATLVLFGRIGAREILGGAALIGLIACAVLYFYPDTVDVSIGWFDKVILSDSSPKKLVVEAAGSVMMHPKNLILGTGLGQFTSRGALIATGDFLNFQFPSFLLGSSEIFSRYVAPIIYLFDTTGEGSAIPKPYFSVLSVFVELGPFLFIIVSIAIFRELKFYLEATQSKIPEVKGVARCLAGMTIFFLLCSFIEDYAEFVPAMALPALYFVIDHGRLCPSK